MTRIVAAVIVWATTTVLAVSQEASFSAEVVSAGGAQAGIRRGLAEADEYVGCFADMWRRVMTDKLVDSDMTPALCRSHCQDKGAIYYATQRRRKCYCGYSEEASDYEVCGSATCDKKCAGDTSLVCGGTWAFSLYKLADDEPTTTPAPTPIPSQAPTAFPVQAPTPIPSQAPTAYNGGLYGTEYTGDGTYYAVPGVGTCGFGSDVLGMYSGMLPVALPTELYSDSLMCGACLEGTASGFDPDATTFPLTYNGYVADEFVGGNGGDLDFAVSVSGTVGVWDIEWKFVACPGEAISFTFGISNPYFWSLQPRGTKTPVESLTINGQEAARDQFNYFKLAGGPWTGAQTVVTTTLAGVVQTSQVTLD